MKIKDLIWTDAISELGKKEGIFEIHADVIVGGSYIVEFGIRNYDYDGSPLIDKFRLFVRKGAFNEESFEFKTVEEAKEKSQLEFKKRILELFFDDEALDFLSKNEEVKSKGIDCFGDEEALKGWLLSSTLYSKGYLKSKKGRVIEMQIGRAHV